MGTVSPSSAMVSRDPARLNQYGPFPREGSDGEPMVGGLDEAGRGSWIGPMVLGAFRLPREGLGRLVELGIRDSKLLTPGRRTLLASELARTGEIR
ncbi:Ribonuclease HII/HIII, partial [mine drainage metagenome]